MSEASSPFLLQRWLHSHEEDTPTQRVYRPSTFSFPPSRGRTGFELRPDHACTRVGIAATDGSTEEWGVWELKQDDGQQLVLTLPSGKRDTLQIVSLDHDRLVVRK